MRRFLFLVIGLGLLGLGAYLLLYLDGSVDFGWYAFTPEEAETRVLDGEITVLTQTQLLGAGARRRGADGDRRRARLPRRPQGLDWWIGGRPHSRKAWTGRMPPIADSAPEITVLRPVVTRL